MPWQDRVVDLRVEDHPRPLDEMRRLLKIHGAYVHANNGDALMEKGEIERALEEYSRSADLYPENVELRFWQAVSMLNHGQVRGEPAILRTVFRANERPEGAAEGSAVGRVAEGRRGDDAAAPAAIGGRHRLPLAEPT